MQHRPKTRLTVLSAMVLAMLLGPSTGAMADGWGKNPPSANEHSVTYDMSTLINLVDALSHQAKAKINNIQNRGENISIADMFDMQMNMNHLAQMSEMSTSIVNATNTAVMSMARNIKG